MATSRAELDVDTIGLDWLAEQVAGLTVEVDRMRPSEYVERVRYLPASVTSLPGPFRFDVVPHLREIVDCFDVDSPVREVTVKKGVQVGYTTLLESVLLYFMGHVKTAPCMYMTADLELARSRIENNILPMLNESGLAEIVRSADEGNARKTGKTKHHIQFEGGGVLYPFGAGNADKMRTFAILLMLKDELDAWPDVVGRDGDPDALSSDRCSAYWAARKIGRGGTPLIKGSSKVEKAYRRGDQREYRVRCLRCNEPQALRWSGTQRTGSSTGSRGSSTTTGPSYSTRFGINVAGVDMHTTSTIRSGYSQPRRAPSGYPPRRPSSPGSDRITCRRSTPP